MKRLAFVLCALVVVSSVGVAPAASQPVIKRAWSWNVTSTSAGLSMEFDNQGQRSVLWFEYATSATMAGAARTDEATDLGCLCGNNKHSQLRGLRPDTVYYYRALMRTPENGTLHTSVQTFHTAR